MTSCLGLLALTAALSHAQDAAVPRDRPGDVMPDRHWDIVHLDLAVRIDVEAGTVDGRTEHTVRPLGNRHGTLRLHQAALDIEAVTVDGEPVTDWRIGRHTLDIPMPAEGDEHVVAIDYTATPQTGLHFRVPGRTPHPVLEVWSQGEDSDNRHWFPSWDHPSDKFTLTTEITAPSGLLAHANGVLEDKAEAEPGWTTWRYALDRPIVNYLVALTVGDHQVIADEGQVPLEYIGAATHDPAFVRRGFDRAKPQMAYLADLLDEPFPYPVYRQVVVSGFLYGGMENASITIMSDRGLQPSDDSGLLRLEELTAHEIAHQWFGDLVTCYGWRELWLNEGFATFYTGRWMEHTRGTPYYATKVRGWHRSAARLTTPMSPRGWSAVDGEDNAGVYVRGATVLHMLRVMLGDEVYDAGIRLYLDRHADRLVETDDLRRALEDVSGTHLGWFFDQYVHGTGIPALTSGWSWSEGELTLQLDQDTGEGLPFHMPVEVELGLADGVRTRTLWLGEGQTRLVLELDQAPRWVAVDPRGGVLADWTQEQEPGAWAAQARFSPSPFARIEALEQLGQAPADPVAVEALVAVLADEALEPRIREVAARSLGTLSAPEALVALNQHRTESDPYLREVVVRALGEVGPDEPTKAWLTRAARTDVDPDVRGAAIEALASADSQRGGALARALVTAPDRSWQQQVHQSALQVLGEHGRFADVGTATSRVDPRSPRSVWYRAAWAAVSLIQAEDDPPEAPIRRLEQAVIRGLDSEDQRIREASIGLLAAIGSEDGEQALQRFAAANEVFGLTEQALAAAATIRTGSVTVEEGGDEVDVERLEQAIEALEERIERLEDWR